MLNILNAEGGLRKARAALLCCAVLFFSFFIFPANALALNSDYLSSEKWFDNGKTTTVYIEGTSLDNRVNGYFSYYTDDSLCIYTCFKISETTLTEDTDNIFITYDFHMPGEDYSLTLGSDGLFPDENHPEGETVFRSASNFSEFGSYYSAAQYVGKDYSSCTVDITLKVNGHIYSITENGELYGKTIYMEIPTTVKETTTKATTTKRSAATKSSATATKRSKKETTTKFKPQYNLTTKPKVKTRSTPVDSNTSTKETTNEEPATEPSSLNESLKANESKTEMTPSARRFLILGGIFALAGAIALIAAKNVKAKEEKNKKTDKQNNDDNEHRLP